MNRRFKINELRESAKRKALQRLVDEGWGWNDIDREGLTESFKETLEAKGIEVDYVNWSLGYCQGDGVAVNGKIDLQEIVPNLIKDFSTSEKRFIRAIINNDLLEAECVKGRSYYTRVEFELYYNVNLSDRTEKIIEKFCSLVEKYVLDMVYVLERTGYDEIEYKESKECLEDLALVNGLEFTEEGLLVG